MFQLRTGESCLTMDILKRNENLESALAGFNITKYIPPQLKGDNDSDTDNIGSDLDASADNSTAEENSDDKELAKMFGIDVSDEDVAAAAENITEYSSPDSDTEHSNKKRSKSSRTKCSTQSRNDVTMVTKAAKSAKKSNNNNNASESRTEIKVVSKAKEQKVVSKAKVSKVKDNEVECATYSSVGDLFDHCGVLHVHENRKVVGSSKAEDHMSKCAIQDVYELHQNLQIPAAYCQPFSESDEESDFDVKTLTARSGRKKKGFDYNSARTMVIGNAKVLIGQTPRAIRQKEFKKMSQHCGIGDLTELAENILKGSVNERMDMLKEFYGSQNIEYRQIFEISETETLSPSPQNITKSSRKQKKFVTKKNQRSRKRSKFNQTLGISYDNSDSESQTKNARQEIDSLKCSEGSWDIGKKITPKSHKKLSANTRLRSSKSQKICTKTSNSCYQTENTSKTKHYYVEEVYHSHSNSDSESDGINSEILLKTMVKKTNSHEESFDYVKVEKDKEKDVTEQDMSVLDDIFLNKGSSNQRKRKPPPGKKQTVKNKNLDDLLTDDSSIMDESSCTDEVDGILDESTLKDEMFDCFGDPQKWKKRKRKKDKSALSAVERLIIEGDEEYEQLFTSGKMKKNSKNLPKTVMDSSSPNKKVKPELDKKSITDNNLSPNKKATSTSSKRLNCDEELTSFDASKSLFSV